MPQCLWDPEPLTVRKQVMFLPELCPAVPLGVLLAAAPLTGCGWLLTEATAAVAAIAGAATKDATVGAAIGLGEVDVALALQPWPETTRNDSRALAGVAN